MEWFSGSIPDAVQTAKSRQCIFVVYISGSDDLSKEMDQTWQDASVGDFCRSQNWVALKLAANSEACSQFSQIYPVVCFPCTYFIGSNGTPLEITAGSQTPQNFLEILNKVQKMNAGPAESDAVQTSSNTLEKDNQTSNQTTKETVTLEKQVPESTETQAQPSSATSDSLYSSDEETKSPAEGTSASDSSKDRIARAQELIRQKKIEKAHKVAEDEKQKEFERRSLGQNLQKFQDWKEEQNRKETVSSWKKDKEEEKKARERVREQIARDKAERAARANKEKEERLSAPTTSSQSTVNKDIARLQFRLPDGSSVTEQFQSSQTLQEAYNFIQQRMGSSMGAFALATVYPRCQFTDDHLEKTLRDLDLAPAAVLMVLPGKGKPSQKPKPAGGSGSARGGSSFLWILLAPFIGLWNFIMGFIFGRGSGNSGAIETSPRQQTEQPEGATAAMPGSRPSANTRPKSSYGLRSRKEGNIRRFTNMDEDDESATWNGNSTQQM